MAKDNRELLAFNRGVISPLGLARVDVPRVALAAQTQINWIPRALGAMSLRPGLEYIGATRNNAAAKHIPFVYSNSDKAIIELTDYAARVRVDDALVTRASVSTTITNGGFDTDLTGWTDSDESGAVSSWLTGGYLSLLGDGTNAAIRDQTLAIAGGDQNVAHALKIVVARGPVAIRIGSSSGGEEYFEETELLTGTHSIAFTPTGANAYVRLLSRSEYPTLVDSCAIESAGAMTITTIWPAAALASIRYTQSLDVVFVTCDSYRPQRIQRWASGSWSVCDYVSDYGPFRNDNLTNITLTPSALTGLITLTASKNLFKSSQVGALFKVTSNGQTVSQQASAANTFSNSITVTGVSTARIFGITLSGSWSGTVTLQRSYDDGATWTDLTTYTANTSTTLDDALDNQIVYYRIGVKTGEWTTGTVTMELTYASGSITGVVRISAYTSATTVTGYVVRDLGALTATSDWAEGSWSSYRGFPAACALRDGRLCLVGKDKFWASVVDDYSNHDYAYEGDAGPINRSVGEGPMAAFKWLVSSTGLIAGSDSAPVTIRASVDDIVLTPSNAAVRPIESLGSANVDAELVGTDILFVDQSGTRLNEITGGASQGYAIGDLSVLCPEIFTGTVVDLAVQRHPDTRVHAVLSDGDVAMLIYSKTEEVRAWLTIETDGLVEEAFVLPGSVEDAVYYVVRRTINGGTVRYLEKWALTDECVGGTANKQADAFYHYSGAATATISGLDHLEGETVVCWADGIDQGSFTVSSGAITLGAAVSEAIVGLSYTAQFKSTKLASTGLSLIARKRVAQLGVILANTHAQGLQYGPDFDTLDDLPVVEASDDVDLDGIWEDYNYEHFPFNGNYDVNSRLCLQATAPRPVTVLAAVIELDKQ